MEHFQFLQETLATPSARWQEIFTAGDLQQEPLRYYGKASFQ